MMTLAFVPLYIKFMGVEAYGLIGLFTTLQVVLGLLDMGLSGTLNREIARLSTLPDQVQEMRNMVRTLETLYWFLACVIGMVIVTLSPFMAHRWVQAEQIPPEAIEQALSIMGLVISIQMCSGFYSGGLMGLQKQVLLNKINVVTSTLRGVGAVLLLWLVSSTVQTFFWWQIVASAISTFLVALFLWRELPSHGEKAVFQIGIVKNIWKFTAGMSGIAILVMVLTQLDKIILSKMLSLEMFGYYTLASAVAMSLGRLTGPVFYAIYPRLTQLVSLDDQEGLKHLYHQSCQFMSVLILPIAIVVALFSYEILFLWTQNPLMAEKSHLLVSILVCGTALNGLMNIPYALQLASGWTSLSLIKNLIAIILLVPLIIYMTIHYGAVGAASGWLILNMGYILFEIPIIHRRLLRREKWRWYIQDVCLPLLAGLSLAGLGRLLFVRPNSEFLLMLYLITLSLLTLGITGITTPIARTWLYRRVFDKFSTGHQS